MIAERASHEIAHGKKLAAADPEHVWGWGTPAGKLRAAGRARRIGQGAKLAPGMKALEVGCGTGLFTRLLEPFGAEIVAVDISPELLEIARQRSNSPRAVYLEKRFEECDIDGPFDAVVGSSILHHLEQEVSFRRIFALLRPGGLISFAEPNMLNPQIMIQKNVAWIKERLGDSPDETAFVRWRLERMLARLGFTEIQVTPFDWLHPATPRPLIPALTGLTRVLESIPCVREFAGSLHIRARRPL